MLLLVLTWSPAVGLLMPLSRSRTICRLSSASSEEDWLAGALNRELKREGRKLRSLEKEATEASKAEGLGKWAQLVVANMYRLSETDRTAWVEDWEKDGELVELVFSKPPQVEAEEAFATARRLKRGSKVVEKLIAASRARLNEIEAASTLEDAARLGIQRLGVEPCNQLSKPKVKPRVKRKTGWTGRTFEAPESGVPVLVGRNRRENDYLSCVLAKSPDVWLHARGAPGAHVLIQFSKDVKVKGKPEADLQFAANIAAYYSELRTETKAWISCADPRHIWKPPKAPPGAVVIRHELPPILGFPENVPANLSQRTS